MAARQAIPRVFLPWNSTFGAVVFAQSSAADQAHLGSHSGGGASEVLCVNPTKSEFTMVPSIFRCHRGHFCMWAAL